MFGNQTQNCLTDNKHNVFKDFKFRGLTIHDSAKQVRVSAFFLRKLIVNLPHTDTDILYLAGKQFYVT